MQIAGSKDPASIDVDLPAAGAGDPYDWRSVTIGSTRVARCAGT
jgi:hypothetical protein